MEAIVVLEEFRSERSAVGIDESKLENCRRKGNKITARCPACFEAGHDRQGNHLILSDDGRFGCVKYPGLDGKDHRKRIFQLVGAVASKRMTIDVKQASHPSQNQDVVLMKNVLGRLGHHFKTSY